MHVDHELVEFVPADEQDYEEIIEEYEEDVFVLDGASEPVGADFADLSPAQGKPRCITLILNDYWIYIYDVYLRYRHFMETTCIDILTYEFSIGRVAAMLRISVAWVTCRYSQVGDKYDHSW